jgi:tetratricopeptide (TPR) repeat protein
VGARSTGTDVSFRVVATPQTLLSTAPAAPPFRREDVLGADALGDVAARLRSPDASAAMAAALDAARDARFMDLLRDDAIGEGEQGARAALKGIGLYALGDGRIACTILRQSMESAPSAATLLYLGACRALERNDRDAITAWRGALAGHVPPAVVVPLLVGAHLRLGEAARAQELAERLVTNNLPPGAIVSGLAAAYIAQGREADAIPILQAHLTVHGDDLEATYGLLHALFAGFVGGQGMGAAPEGKERFRTLARRYIDAKGRNAVAVSEWLEMVKQ